MPPNESGRLMAPRKRPWTVARLVLARLDRLGSRIVALREVADAEDRLKRLSVGREATRCTVMRQSLYRYQQQSNYESGGQEFESLRARHLRTKPRTLVAWVWRPAMTISLPLSFGGMSYSTIARAMAVCASSVVDDAGELRRRALDVEDGPGVPLLLFGRLLSHGSSHGTL